MSLAFLFSFSAWGFLVLRLALGAVFVLHGFPKLKNYAKMGQGMGMPGPAVLLLGAVETISGLLVATGTLEQFGALAMALVMLGAPYHKMFKWHVPFMGQQATGWEFDLILFAAAVLILTNGDGGITLCRFLGGVCPQL